MDKHIEYVYSYFNVSLDIGIDKRNRLVNTR